MSSSSYTSKINSNSEKQVILLIIPNEEKKACIILQLKKLSTLLRGRAKHHGNFYCLNFLHSFRKEDEVKSHEKLCKNKDFCGIIMPSEKDNILEFNQCMK